MTTQLLRLPAVLERTGLTRSRLYSRVNEGTFPKPVKLGRSAAWPDSEIQSWIAARIAERETA